MVKDNLVMMLLILWNSLQVHIGQATTVQCFKIQLQTYLYKQAFDKFLRLILFVTLQNFYYINIFNILIFFLTFSANIDTFSIISWLSILCFVMSILCKAPESDILIL